MRFLLILFGANLVLDSCHQPAQTKGQDASSGQTGWKFRQMTFAAIDD